MTTVSRDMYEYLGELFSHIAQDPSCLDWLTSDIIPATIFVAPEKPEATSTDISFDPEPITLALKKALEKIQKETIKTNPAETKYYIIILRTIFESLYDNDRTACSLFGWTDKSYRSTLNDLLTVPDALFEKIPTKGMVSIIASAFNKNCDTKQLLEKHQAVIKRSLKKILREITIGKIAATDATEDRKKYTELTQFLYECTKHDIEPLRSLAAYVQVVYLCYNPNVEIDREGANPKEYESTIENLWEKINTLRLKETGVKSQLTIVDLNTHNEVITQNLDFFMWSMERLNFAPKMTKSERDAWLEILPKLEKLTLLQIKTIFLKHSARLQQIVQQSDVTDKNFRAFEFLTQHGSDRFRNAAAVKLYSYYLSKKDKTAAVKQLVHFTPENFARFSDDERIEQITRMSNARLTGELRKLLQKNQTLIIEMLKRYNTPNNWYFLTATAAIANLGIQPFATVAAYARIIYRLRNPALEADEGLLEAAAEVGTEVQALAKLKQETLTQHIGSPTLNIIEIADKSGLLVENPKFLMWLMAHPAPVSVQEWVEVPSAWITLTARLKKLDAENLMQIFEQRGNTILTNVAASVNFQLGSKTEETANAVKALKLINQYGSESQKQASAYLLVCYYASKQSEKDAKTYLAQLDWNSIDFEYLLKTFTQFRLDKPEWQWLFDIGLITFEKIQSNLPNIISRLPEELKKDFIVTLLTQSDSTAILKAVLEKNPSILDFIKTVLKNPEIQRRISKITLLTLYDQPNSPSPADIVSLIFEPNINEAIRADLFAHHVLAQNLNNEQLIELLGRKNAPNLSSLLQALKRKADETEKTEAHQILVPQILVIALNRGDQIESLNELLPLIPPTPNRSYARNEDEAREETLYQLALNVNELRIEELPALSRRTQKRLCRELLQHESALSKHYDKNLLTLLHQEKVKDQKKFNEEQSQYNPFQSMITDPFTDVVFRLLEDPDTPISKKQSIAEQLLSDKTLEKEFIIPQKTDAHGRVKYVTDGNLIQRRKAYLGRKIRNEAPTEEESHQALQQINPLFRRAHQLGILIKDITDIHQLNKEHVEKLSAYAPTSKEGIIAGALLLCRDLAETTSGQERREIIRKLNELDFDQIGINATDLPIEPEKWYELLIQNRIPETFDNNSEKIGSFLRKFLPVFIPIVIAKYKSLPPDENFNSPNKYQLMGALTVIAQYAGGEESKFAGYLLAHEYLNSTRRHQSIHDFAAPIFDQGDATLYLFDLNMTPHTRSWLKELKREITADVLRNWFSGEKKLPIYIFKDEKALQFLFNEIRYFEDGGEDVLQLYIDFLGRCEKSSIYKSRAYLRVASILCAQKRTEEAVEWFRQIIPTAKSELVESLLPLRVPNMNESELTALLQLAAKKGGKYLVCWEIVKTNERLRGKLNLNDILQRSELNCTNASDEVSIKTWLILYQYASDEKRQDIEGTVLPKIGTKELLSWLISNPSENLENYLINNRENDLFDSLFNAPKASEKEIWNKVSELVFSKQNLASRWVTRKKPEVRNLYQHFTNKIKVKAKAITSFVLKKIHELSKVQGKWSGEDRQFFDEIELCEIARKDEDRSTLIDAVKSRLASDGIDGLEKISPKLTEHWIQYAILTSEECLGLLNDAPQNKAKRHITELTRKFVKSISSSEKAWEKLSKLYATFEFSPDLSKHLLLQIFRSEMLVKDMQRILNQAFQNPADMNQLQWPVLRFLPKLLRQLNGSDSFFWNNLFEKGVPTELFDLLQTPAVRACLTLERQKQLDIAEASPRTLGWWSTTKRWLNRASFAVSNTFSATNKAKVHQAIKTRAEIKIELGAGSTTNMLFLAPHMDSTPYRNALRKILSYKNRLKEIKRLMKQREGDPRKAIAKANALLDEIDQIELDTGSARQRVQFSLIVTYLKKLYNELVKIPNSENSLRKLKKLHETVITNAERKIGGEKTISTLTHSFFSQLLAKSREKMRKRVDAIDHDIDEVLNASAPKPRK